MFQNEALPIVQTETKMIHSNKIDYKGLNVKRHQYKDGNLFKYHPPDTNLHLARMTNNKEDTEINIIKMDIIGKRNPLYKNFWKDTNYRWLENLDRKNALDLTKEKQKTKKK